MTERKTVTREELLAALPAACRGEDVCDVHAELLFDGRCEDWDRGVRDAVLRFFAALPESADEGLREAAQAVIDEAEIRVMDGDGSIGVRLLSKHSATIQRLRAALAATQRGRGLDIYRPVRVSSEDRAGETSDPTTHP